MRSPRPRTRSLRGLGGGTPRGCRRSSPTSQNRAVAIAVELLLELADGRLLVRAPGRQAREAPEGRPDNSPGQARRLPRHSSAKAGGRRPG